MMTFLFYVNNRSDWFINLRWQLYSKIFIYSYEQQQKQKEYLRKSYYYKFVINSQKRITWAETETDFTQFKKTEFLN